MNPDLSVRYRVAAQLRKEEIMDADYADIMQLMQQTAKKEQVLSFRTGTVISADPIEIDVGGITAGSGKLSVNEFLLKQIERPVDCELTEGEHIVKQGWYKFKENQLKAGDQVLLITDRDRYFYLVGKMVKV